MAQGVLLVTLQFACDLHCRRRLFGRQSPFCILTCGQQQFRTRTCVAGGRHPSWDEAFRVHVGNEEHLEVDILDDTSPKSDELIGSAQIPIAPAQLRSTAPQQLEVPLFSSKSHDLRSSGSKSSSSGFLRAALSLSSSFSRSSRKPCGVLSVVLQWSPSRSPGGTSRGSARWSPPAPPPPHVAPYQLSRIRALSFAASTGTQPPPVFVQRAASAHVRTPPRQPLPPLPPTAHSPAIPRASPPLPSPAHHVRAKDRHSSPPVGSPHASAAAGAAAAPAAAPAAGGCIAPPGLVRGPHGVARGSAAPGESRVRHIQALSAPGSAVYSAVERGRGERSTTGTEGVGRGRGGQQLVPPQGNEGHGGRVGRQQEQQRERMQQDQQAVVGARSVSASPVAAAAGAAWAAALGATALRPGR